MCLITSKRDYQIAEEDIPVFKILTADYRSVIQNFKYLPNILYENYLGIITEEILKESPELWYEIRPADPIDGNYLREELNWNFKHGYDDRFTYVTRGFHSYFTEDRAKTIYNIGVENYNNIIVKFMIPKGSKYILDDTGLCVSDKIIMIV